MIGPLDLLAREQHSTELHVDSLNFKIYFVLK